MKVSVGEAQSQLKELIELAQTGLEIVLTRADGQPVARLIAAGPREKEPRQPGTLKGTVLYMAPDFDAPLEEFKEYMP